MMPEPIIQTLQKAYLEVSHLEVKARLSATDQERVIVDDVSFSLASGEVMALVGETGSGKSTIALSLLGYARPGCRVSAGSITLGGASILELTTPQIRKLRGDRIAYIAQSAAAAFNPSKTIMSQVIEGVVIHGLMTRSEACNKARKLFGELALPEPDRIGNRYPHQVSGGQLQRAMAAMALLSEPALIILDEPTTALDVTTQVEVLKVFKKVVRKRGTTAVYVSHDLSVVAQVADQVLVLNNGCVREIGYTTHIINSPSDSYTQALIKASETVRPEVALRNNELSSEVLVLDQACVGYGRSRRGEAPEKIVLSDISCRLEKGQALGVIGESGSGKSTLAQAVSGLVTPFSGGITFEGEALPLRLEERSLRQFQRIQMVFQSADNALNASHTVRRMISRPLRRYFKYSRNKCEQRVCELLDMVMLPTRILESRPSALSGGQKQRVNIARALAAEPSLLICDEVTSALDTIVSQTVLELLVDLRKELGLSYLFISHDISAVQHVCDELLVLYQGRIVEQGLCQEVIKTPHHPYTQKLIQSIPQMRTDWLDEVTINSEIM